MPRAKRPVDASHRAGTHAVGRHRASEVKENTERLSGRSNFLFLALYFFLLRRFSFSNFPSFPFRRSSINQKLSTMILTKKNIRDLSHSGGFTKAQLKLLGVSWPPREGWIMAIVGTEISEELYVKIFKLRSQAKPKQEKRDLAPAENECEPVQVPIELVPAVRAMIEAFKSRPPRS